MHCRNACLTGADTEVREVSGSHGTNICMCAADQWDVQATIQRLNELLIAHGYATWFDLTNMKGSTVDAMSDAIEG